MMRRRPIRAAFTLLELLMCVSLLSVITYSIWDSYRSGLRQNDAAGDSMSASQNAMVLMESMQEDVRQIAILNMQKKTAPGAFSPSLIPYSMFFSTNGKSLMLRKSTLTDSSGEMNGSSFSVVTYSLLRRSDLPAGVYTVRRLERAVNGTVIDDTLFRSVFVRDIQFDLVVRLDGMTAYQTFVRVSITAVNSGLAQRDDRAYYISNLFNITAPEFVHNRPDSGEIGFARRFPYSLVFAPSGNVEIVGGSGFYGELPPPGFPEFAGFKDYVDIDGIAKDMAVPAAGTNPFVGEATGPNKRVYYCKSGRDYLKDLAGQFFRGRITGQIVSRPGVLPTWVEPFSFDTTRFATESVATQVNASLGNMIARGPAAVQDLGHTIRSRASSVSTALITTAEANDICNGL